MNIITNKFRISALKLSSNIPNSIFCKYSKKNSVINSVGTTTARMVRILSVAEKNDAAKNIAELLSQGRYNRREGRSRFNKIYEFEYSVLGQRSQMVMTSVSGHLLNYEFVGSYQKWNAVAPLTLFEAPVLKQCSKDYENIKRTLEEEARRSDLLIIWTDCDREGENIGFEIIQVCTAVKRGLQVYRARFSEITTQSVRRAINNLIEPDKRVSDAVDVRQELDLRIGAAFTRFQTMRLNRVYPETLGGLLISYGSCQFPTLGFVVERYRAIQDFVPENFYKIRVTWEPNDTEQVEFSWKRNRLFSELATQVLLDKCQENPEARVVNVQTKPKSKWRPLPLDTVELEKIASRKLRITAKETMKIAERLYTQGYISYPRTETNIFPNNLDLNPLVAAQTNDPNWGQFAQRVLNEGPNPRQGRNSDQAHPPIHPIKYADNLRDDKERRVYEFIVRRFLACLSKDAQGFETVVDIDINGEGFVASGLQIVARNYLEVYPYEKWSDKSLPTFSEGQTFQPTVLEMTEGETSPPQLLTEADLIALMEKHGIGTDATHAEHIETIKDRKYVGLQPDGRFLPGSLGMGLVQGYDAMGLALSKPHLRAELEADLKRICEGTRSPEEVRLEQIAKYREVFVQAMEQVTKIDEALGEYLNEDRQEVGQVFSEATSVSSGTKCAQCANCGSDIVVKTRRDNAGFYLSCTGYPQCKTAVWFPSSVINVSVNEATCPRCPTQPHLLDLTFQRGALAPFYPDNFTGCVGGCDRDFLQVLDVRPLPQNPGTSQTERNYPGTSENVPAATRPGTQSTGRSTFQNVPVVQRPRTLPRSQPGTQLHGTDTFQNVPVVQRPGTFSRSQPGTQSTGRSNNDSGYNTSRTSNRQDEGEIVCCCNEVAVILTVRKEGPNKGRQFYKCPKLQGQGNCDFFLWADRVGESADSSSAASHTAAAATTEESPDNQVLCSCGEPAKSLTVQKEGPNKGRPFYACSKPYQSQCRFFQWADQSPDSAPVPTNSSYGTNSNRGNFFGGSNRSRGTRGRARGRAASSAGTRRPAGTRKCGNCGEEGHTRNRCPNNDDV